MRRSDFVTEITMVEAPLMACVYKGWPIFFVPVERHVIHLTLSVGTVSFIFPRISMFSETKSREILRLRFQSLNVNCL